MDAVLSKTFIDDCVLRYISRLLELMISETGFVKLETCMVGKALKKRLDGTYECAVEEVIMLIDRVEGLVKECLGLVAIWLANEVNKFPFVADSVTKSDSESIFMEVDRGWHFQIGHP